MKNYAVIENNVVANVIVADDEFASSIGAIPIEDGFGIGDIFENGKIVKHTLSEAELKIQRVAEIKVKAGQLIEAKYPTYKQLNIIRLGGVDLETMTSYIDGIRAISNEAENNGTKLEDIVWE